MALIIKYVSDPDKFFWQDLPVINGLFTLRQALSPQLIEKINNFNLDLNLDINISTFENIPCSREYCLRFGSHTLIVSKETNLVDSLYISSTDKTQNLTLQSHFENSTHNSLEFELNDITKNIEFYNKIELSKILEIPQNLLDNIHVMVCNGEISNKDGQLW